jgi:predicted NBD/HSP70 family sugar kinase
VVLALEVNVDSLAAAVVGLGGTVHDLVRVERPRAHLSLDEIAADLATLADPLIAPWRSDPALLGVGVAVAGVVRRSDGVVRHAPNLGWRDAPLGARLGQVLGLDLPVAVANEADLGGLAEHRRGAATGVGSVVFVTGEVGVGGNLIVDGRPLVGAAGYAGEIGHLPVNPGGARCGCGAVGCWETEIGERALLLRAGRPVDGGRAAVEDVIAAAARGDADALAAMEQLGDWLGLGVAALVNILNPTLVVLGGLFERIHRFMAPSIERALEEHALAASRELVSVVPGQLGSDAPVLGAAELALEPLLADPASRLGPTRRAVAMGA